MPISPERRDFENRRQREEPREPLERAGDRRGEERRDALRPIRRFAVVERPGEAPAEVQGDLSLDGARYERGGDGELPSTVELHLRLPDLAQIAQVRAQVVRTEKTFAEAGERVSVYVEFMELDVRTGLSLARLLDFESRLAAARRS